MTSVVAGIRKALGRLVEHDVPGAPDADLVVSPETPEETAAVLRMATEHGLRVLVWGRGHHQGFGARVEPDIVLSTHRLARWEAWESDDLTVTVEAGVRLGELERRLLERRQTAVLPEVEPDASVGGIVASGLSGFRRLRYGPTRDRVLEVVLVTGDGRIVRGGGRVVKNVTGYDLPRLVVGSFGALGVVVSTTFKLWPLPPATATLTLDDPDAALDALYRPLAVLSAADGRGGSTEAWAYLEGAPEEVAAQAERVGGRVEPGLAWPAPPSGAVRLSLRVPPRALATVLEHVPSGWPRLVEHGVGIVHLAMPEVDVEALRELRRVAEGHHGHLVIVDAPAELYDAVDPWGAPPPSLPIQRRLVAAFDPAGVVNPGRSAGGL